jgi:hypothetical protein
MAPNSPILGSQTRQNVMSGQAGISAQNVGAAINPQPISSPEDIQALQVTQQNQVQIQSLQVGLNGIQNQLKVLNTGLTNISTLIQNDTAAQEQILLQEQERQRRLDEQKVRAGKESEIEQKIAKAFEGAASRVNRQLTGLFGRVNAALMFLFTGWAINKWSDLISAEQQNNSQLVLDIQRSILDGIRNTAVGYSIFKAGLLGGITNVLSFAQKVTSFTLGRPFRSLENLGRRLLGLTPKPQTKLNFSGGNAVKRLLPGKTGRGLATIFEVAQGNPLETGLGLASFLPGKFGLLSGAFQVGENISELVGVNEGQGFIPDGTYEPVLNTETGSFKNPFSNFDVGSFFGFGGKDKKEEGEETVQPEAQSSANVDPAEVTPTTSETTEPQEVTLSPEDLEAYNKALKNKDNPLAQGIIKSKFNELTPEKQQQFRDYAAQQGDDFGDLIPPAPTPSPVSTPEPKIEPTTAIGDASSVEPKETMTGAKVGDVVTDPEIARMTEEENYIGRTGELPDSMQASITSNPESMQAPPPKMNQLPKLSEPAPQIIAANAQQKQTGGGLPRPTAGDGITMVPDIKTSNSDVSQYTMLSMAIYNAVA